MDQLRQSLANIQEQIGKMTASQKLLLASLTVIAAMTLFLVSQYAAKPAMVELMEVSGEGNTIRALQGGGFGAEIVDGKIVLPQGQQYSALAYLTESGQLPGDTTLLFSNLINSQDWKGSKEQHRQQAQIARQNELARTLSSITGIYKASVMLDVPMTTGLGRASRTATASVTLFTTGGSPLTQNKVDAAARLVSGSVVGLTPDNVEVIDGTTGRARTASSDDTESSSQYLEYATQVEKHTKQKIEGLFGHITGVVISITARVDVTKVQSSEKMYSKEGSLSLVNLDKKTSNSSSGGSQGGEAGVRSNEAASINTGSGTGPTVANETGDTQFDNRFGERVKSVIDPRGMPTHLSASIIIPQEYIQSIIEQSREVAEGEELEPVTTKEAQDYFVDFRPVIEGLIQPHLVTVGENGQTGVGDLMVSMAPIGSSFAGNASIQSAGFMNSLAGGSGMLGASGGLIETALVGVLAVISLVMMLMMVKRSSQKIDLPNAQELVGVPPHLESSGDLVGEASEGDLVMTGIEVDDQLVEVQQLREQVEELIKLDPQSAAGLVERWAEPAN